METQTETNRFVFAKAKQKQKKNPHERKRVNEIEQNRKKTDRMVKEVKEKKCRR